MYIYMPKRGKNIFVNSWIYLQLRLHYSRVYINYIDSLAFNYTSSNDFLKRIIIENELYEMAKTQKPHIIVIIITDNLSPW